MKQPKVLEIIESNGYNLVNRSTKIHQFKRRDESIYLKPTRKISIVFHPGLDFTVFPSQFSKRFYPYWNSNMRQFPKKLRGGQKPENYGVSIDLAINELSSLLSIEHAKSRNYNDLLRTLNSKYADTPQFVQEVVKQIQRPSSLRNAILLSRGPTCQICKYPGFGKRSGGVYAETHHMIELNKVAPKTLQDWNVLVVCATCHKILHYGDVEAKFLGNGWKLKIESKEIVIKPK